MEHGDLFWYGAGFCQTFSQFGRIGRIVFLLESDYYVSSPSDCWQHRNNKASWNNSLHQQVKKLQTNNADICVHENSAPQALSKHNTMIECTPGYFKLLILCSKFFPPSLLAHCVCHSQFHLCGSMCLICAFPSLSPLLTQFKHTQLSPMEGKVEIIKIEPHIHLTLFLSPLRYIHSSALSYSPKT